MYVIYVYYNTYMYFTYVCIFLNLRVTVYKIRSCCLTKCKLPEITKGELECFLNLSLCLILCMCIFCLFLFLSIVKTS